MPKSKVRKKRPQQRTGGASAWQSGYRPPGYPPRRPQAPRTPDEFDTWVISTWRLRWTLLVTFAAVCATVVCAMVLGTDERGLQAYENAPICASGQNVGCRAEIPVTVEDRGQSGSTKDPTYYVDVSGAAPADGQIDLPSQSALWNSATAGDSATAIVWDGVVTRIDDNGVDGDTSQAPGIRVVLVQGLLIAFAVWIIASAVFVARIAQSTRGDEEGWTRHLAPLEIPALLAAIFFPISAVIGQKSDSLIVSVAVGGGLTALAGVYFVVSWRRNR